MTALIRKRVDINSVGDAELYEKLLREKKVINDDGLEFVIESMFVRENGTGSATLCELRRFDQCL